MRGTLSLVSPASHSAVVAVGLYRFTLHLCSPVDDIFSSGNDLCLVAFLYYVGGVTRVCGQVCWCVKEKSGYGVLSDALNGECRWWMGFHRRRRGWRPSWVTACMFLREKEGSFYHFIL